jgi:putative DNA primase/helicase
MNTILNLIGAENVCSLNLQHLRNRFYLGTLRNKLLNLSSEATSRSPLDDNIFKQVISGDLIKADRKFKEPIEFRPFAKHCFAMNENPVITDRTHALERRLIVIRFKNVFSGAAQDKNLEKKLSKELSGILNWALEGLHRVLSKDEIFVSKQMEKDLNSFLLDLNPVRMFVEEKCVITPNAEVSKTELYKEYKSWAWGAGMKPMSRTRFYKQLELDYPKITIDTFGVRKFKGIGLRSEGHGEEGDIPF